MDSLNCPSVLANGTCSDSSCTLNHNILTCEHCSLVFQTQQEFEIHLKTDKHRNRVRGTAFLLRCKICSSNVTGGGEKGWKAHVKGKRHRANASLQGVSPQIEPQGPESTPKAEVCNICQCLVEHRYWTAHLKNEKHKTREMYTRYRSAVEESETDKNGVSVTGKFDFEFVSPSAAAAGGVCNIATISTSVPRSKVSLLSARLASSQGARLVVPAFSVSLEGQNRQVTISTPVKLALFVKQSFIGRYEDRLELVFRDEHLQRNFVITRTLKVIVANKAEHEAYRPKAPYVPRTKFSRIDIREVVPGEKPPALTVVRYVTVLPKATIPHGLKMLLGSSQSRKGLTDNIRKIFLPKQLDSDTHSRHFRHLLWIEEAKMEEDLERYDITDASLTRYGKYFYLAVPGLAEKRPSVLVGDCILVQERGSTNGRWFEGHVHVLRQSEVGLVFHGSFNPSVQGKFFHVRFKLNRIPVRRQHQAMDTAFREQHIMFPMESDLVPRPSSIKLKLFNAAIATNEPQLQAVASILSTPEGSPPFIIFGPPGTGKTITVIEAIRQILAEVPGARILACAPSNSAVDIIASRLGKDLSPSDMFRFYAPSRAKAQVPHQLVPYTCTTPDGIFTVPIAARLKRYGVVLSTCVSASFAAGIGINRGHFTHIFIDEAGQSTEPETFVSIKTLADNRTNIILSGDPKQLGPIIRSPIARDLGLEVSYLERLMSMDTYNLQTSFGRGVIKLTKNFRSHNAILSFPNEKFYDNELIECASTATKNRFIDSSYLPAKKFPIVFHSVSGKDDREASSPSFFNIDEILQVKSYVQRLKEDRAYRTTDSDIGIIAPYHAQCLKLRNALRNTADGVKVGSVEEFQGQERPVIIISTVRSSREFVEYDLRHTLGFVANPRRFNVAVTRAQALLIIVGDPQVLSLDPLWRAFLNYIYLNGGWTGPDITWDPRETVDQQGRYDKKVRDAAAGDMNEFTRLMEACTLNNEADDELDANVDRPWRNVE